MMESVFQSVLCVITMLTVLKPKMRSVVSSICTIVCSPERGDNPRTLASESFPGGQTVVLLF